MILTVFVVYLLSMLAIGIYTSRYNKSMGDFVIGGRRLGPWVAALSAQASDFSAWLFIGLPSQAYLHGFSMVWACHGCMLGVMFNWLVLAPRLRRLSGEYDALTIPDFLETRFADRSHVIRVLAVLVILVCYVTYISAQFNAAGEVFVTAFDATDVNLRTVDLFGAKLAPYQQGLLIGALVIMAYTAMGGFLAVCWTDFVQAILMVSALVAVPIVGICQLGGFDEFWSRMAAGQHHADMLTVTRGSAGASLAFGVVIAGLAWAMGYPGQPHILARFMAIQDERKIPRGALISVVWTAFALYGSLLVGFISLAIVGPGLGDSAHANQAMPKLVIAMLPPTFAGLVLAAAIAAMMSTVDSQLIVAVSAVVRDIYQRLFGGKPSDRAAVWLSRIVMVALGTGGVATVWRSKSVFGKVFDAWGGLAAGLGPALVLGCLWRRTARSAVVAGMVAGVVSSQFWPQLMAWLDGEAAHAGWIGASTGKFQTQFVQCLNETKLVTTVLVNFVLVIVVSLIFPDRRNHVAAAGGA